jgi:Glycosyl transferase family 2
MSTPNTPAICIVMPIFNDWAALPRLLDNLAEAFRGSGTTLDVVLVNDASTEFEHLRIEDLATHGVICEITVVDLGVNVGHQIAITAGLHYAQQHKSFTAVLIMDADGEDDPRDAVKLVAAWRNQPDHLIAAQRTKRSESLIFRGFYGLYRAIFRLLTGHTISFGNFLLIPATLLPSVLSRPETHPSHRRDVTSNPPPDCRSANGARTAVFRFLADERSRAGNTRDRSSFGIFGRIILPVVNRRRGGRRTVRHRKHCSRVSSLLYNACFSELGHVGDQLFDMTAASARQRAR